MPKPWEPTYTPELIAASEVLAAIDRPGACFTSGTRERFPLPGLTVPGLGPVGLPLDAATAAALVGQCQRAPFGHGEQTLVDTTVRDTWELDRGAFTLANPEWEAFVRGLVDDCHHELGVPPRTPVSARLYKLLLYEPGGRFARHQDSEKEPGMFGTLVIALPGHFAGGELVVHPPGRRGRGKPLAADDVGDDKDNAGDDDSDAEPDVWDPATEPPYALKYAAFYADCEHEVLAVRQGHRLCLTYNLVVTTDPNDDDGNDGNDLVVPRFAVGDAMAMAIRKSLVALLRTAADGRFVYVLEHEYTDNGLAFARLKNKDHLVADALGHFCATSQGEYALYLCRAEYVYEYDKESDEDIERTLYLEAPWIHHGTNVESKLPNTSTDLESEVAPAGHFEDVEYDDSETTYTGNEGTCVKNWYRTAALVILPAAAELSLVAKGDVTLALERLENLVAGSSPLAMGLAQQVFARTTPLGSTSLQFTKCLRIVENLAAPELLFTLLRCKQHAFAFQPQMAQTVSCLEWDAVWPEIDKIATAMGERSRANLVCSIVEGIQDPEKLVKARTLVLQPSSGFASGWDETTNAVEDLARHFKLAMRPPVAADVLQRCAIVRAPLTDVIVPAFVQFSRALGVAVLPEDVQSIASGLRRRAEEQMPPAGSWAFRNLQIPCSCVDCTRLQQFLQSPTERTFRHSAPARQRNHLEHQLEYRARGMVSMATERNGSPHTLVVTKLSVNQRRREASLRAIAGLDALLAGTSAQPMGAAPTEAAQWTPVSCHQEVIVIDDSD